MRLATTIVQPRLALLRRAAVRAFSSGGSEVRASVPLASSLASPLPAAEGSGGVTTNGSSGAPATEAGHVYRKGARAVFDMPPIKDTIELTAEEAALFKELLEATKQAGLGTTLRCAGGWVRDKLMGRSSLDIDIALDNLLGREFADRINDYLQAHGEETRHVAVIMSNPDQSKHLETARMKVRGIWIDLVNLRSEEYAQHSRIPTMTFGTPEQDALRRDFTINSLFYNINTGLIEDFTQRGLADLRDGIIRTPLAPKETFMDDPLRVLRAVRFASRFGFELEEGLLEAAADDEVREALAHKVSRERVGTELEGMFLGEPAMNQATGWNGSIQQAWGLLLAGWSAGLLSGCQGNPAPHCNLGPCCPQCMRTCKCSHTPRTA
jgi:hypothetical protein